MTVQKVMHDFLLHFPALVSGMAVLAYWSQVISMAVRMRRRPGRSANLVPPEPLGRWLRIIWMPVIVIWVAVPFAVGLGVLSPRLFRTLWNSPAIAWPAAVVVVTCWLLTRICWKKMGRSWRMGINPTEKTALVVTGPYARVRHPIYALSQLMVVATAAAAPTPLLVAAALVHVLLLQWEVRREEAHLRLVHGDLYREYCSRVPRFIPNGNAA